MSSVRPLVARAYAKVNLGLEILGRREDGYHEIRTILQTVDFRDELTFRPAGEGVALTTSSQTLSTGPDNLVMRAAALLSENRAVGGVAIHLDKRIPEGMGLGGGSADAAVTLRALNRLWELDLSAEQLHRLAERIGMDVPFFLYGGTAVAVSKGSELYPLPFEGEAPIVLILPDFSISTAAAYSRLRLTKKHSDLKLQHFAWRVPFVGDSLGDLVNHLEGATGEHAPAIERHKNRLLELGATSSMMSGSGAAVFGMFRDRKTADNAASTLTQGGIRAIATKTISRKAYSELWLSDTD